MTISVRSRATVVTADLTYHGHILEIHEPGNDAFVTDRQGVVLREIHNAVWSSKDGSEYRVEGDDADGNRVVWRAVGKCPRCATVKVTPTPDYDVPT